MTSAEIILSACLGMVVANACILMQISESLRRISLAMDDLVKKNLLILEDVNTQESKP